MGKASQAKKAARLARESGEVKKRPKRRLAFPLAVAAAVVVGVLVVAIARQPESTPKLEIDPTSVTADPNNSADTTATTVASPVDSVPATAVSTTVVAGQ